MRLRSIQTRLTLWYTTLLTITVLLLGAVAYIVLGYSLAHDVDAALQGVAQTLAAHPTTSSRPLLPADIDAMFRHFLGIFPWDRYVERRDPWGNHELQAPAAHAKQLPISANALKRAAAGLSTFETVEGVGRYPVRVLTHPVIDAGHVTSVVQVGMSLESVTAAQRRFLFVMAVVLPLGLLSAGGGGWLLARRALRSVDRMTESARRISAEHLDERLDTTGTGDELDRLAHTLNDMLGRLDAGFRQVRQFSADASHELQTPLTILRGELEVALRAPRSPEEYRRVLASALEESERLAHVVEGLLLLARADAGVLRLDRRPLDLAQLVTEVCTQVKILAETHHVALQLGAIDPLTIIGDDAHLRRLLLNLVDNAVKYTPPGGRVTLALQRDGARAALHVSDTGIGLAPDEQGQIFQRFYRASKPPWQDEEGAGLGLCIARSIAEAHGGRIHVESTPGRGSTFTVFLPLRL